MTSGGKHPLNGLSLDRWVESSASCNHRCIRNGRHAWRRTRWSSTDGGCHHLQYKGRFWGSECEWGRIGTGARVLGERGSGRYAPLDGIRVDRGAQDEDPLINPPTPELILALALLRLGLVRHHDGAVLDQLGDDLGH